MGIPPHRNLKKFDLLEETMFEADSTFEEVWPTVREFTQSWDTLDLQCKTKAVSVVIEKLGVKGLRSGYQSRLPPLRAGIESWAPDVG